VGWVLVFVGALLVYTSVTGLLIGFPLVRALTTLLIAGIMLILAGGVVVVEQNEDSKRFR
jgi:uncharacterized membrane protein